MPTDEAAASSAMHGLTDTHMIERVVEQVDRQGHANNVLYVQWMQEAAVAHSSAVGLTPEKYTELGAAFVVRRHEIEYRRPAPLGARIQVHTWITGFRGPTSRRCYRFLNADTHEELARAMTDWVYIDTATSRPTRVPPEVTRLFPVHAGPFETV
jgi:acyl-CoA thioester hydrolase